MAKTNDSTTDEPRRDLLAYLDRALPDAGSVVRFPGGQICPTEAPVARAVLTNEDGLYREHSDFFFSPRGTFGPREAQIEIGRGARAVLRRHAQERTAELAARVERELLPESDWPDAGNWLFFRHLSPALVDPVRTPRLPPLLAEVVERAVLAGARTRQGQIRRWRFRRRVMRDLVRAIEARRAQGTSAPPDDVLDVVVAAAPDHEATALAEVFLSFLFATAGSVGFLLGWSVYLLGRNDPREPSPAPANVVREALRLWPIAWLLARRPAHPHEIAGTPVGPEDEVAVCPYAVHRNADHWPDPDEFRPERWDGPHDPQAFLPFGWGPHRCVAGTLSMLMVEEALAVLMAHRLEVIPRARHPTVEAAVAPPGFYMRINV